MPFLPFPKEELYIVKIASESRKRVHSHSILNKKCDAMINAKPLDFIFLVFAILLTVGCKKDEAGFGTITLNFDHNVGGQNLELEQLKYNSLAGHVYSVVNLRYYVSNFVLRKSDGGILNVDEIHYRDIHDPATRSLVLRNIPDGDYTSLTFVFGLDEDTNVDGGLENTVENINMEWPIPGDQGYHYMKLEGRYDSFGTGVIKNYNLHTGATGGNQNYVEVTLPLSVVAMESNSWNVIVMMDINEWLQNPQTYDFDEFGPNIMMNQAAQVILKANGATVFSISSVTKN
jgi:hypothetical protein